MAEQQKREFKRKPRDEVKDEFEKKLVSVRRVTKVVKGGRNMRLSALVVVGNKKGQVGMGINRATETPAAIEKAGKAAKIRATRPMEPYHGYGIHYTSEPVILKAGKSGGKKK